VPWGTADGPIAELAERVGFEPTVPVRGRRFSRPVHSTALPPLRVRLRRRAIARGNYWKARFRSSWASGLPEMGAGRGAAAPQQRGRRHRNVAARRPRNDAGQWQRDRMWRPHRVLHRGTGRGVRACGALDDGGGAPTPPLVGRASARLFPGQHLRPKFYLLPRAVHSVAHCPACHCQISWSSAP
jgi:hypothetical protein